MAPADSDPKDSPPRSDLFGRYPRLAKAIGGIVGLGSALFLGWLGVSWASARGVSHDFVAAMHQGEVDQARALASPKLQPFFLSERSVDSDPGRTLQRLVRLRHTDLATEQSGFAGHFDIVPYSCFKGTLDDDTPYWIVTAKVSGRWEVVDAASSQPACCHEEH